MMETTHPTVYAVCAECAHVEPRPDWAREDWAACENCGEYNPDCFLSLEDAEARSGAIIIEREEAETYVRREQHGG